VLEFGAGNARKAGPLLDALAPLAYAALDISASALTATTQEIRELHPELPVLGICCDVSRLENLPEHPLLMAKDRLGFYPGSSLGNFDPPAACRLLCRFGRLLGGTGTLLVGIDQPKPVERLEAAYNDRAGCSAAFALNLLERLNRELGGSFDPADFHYRAHWEAEHSRIAMALISRRDHSVQLAGRTWRFPAGEPLITEYSYKYDREAFTALAETAGWRTTDTWSDCRGDVALYLLGQADLKGQR
jgi:dimethylhistidine N-methyltransferase